ncbi:MAG: carboxyl transferase [Clostridia bacterium]|nr:carboxyl transferase [Clostridia bacterium]
MKDRLELFNAKQALLTQTKARQRLAALFDEGSFRELDRFAFSADKPCEVVCGYGLCNGAPLYAFAQDIEVHFGAMGKAQGAKIKRLYDLAAKTGTPIVGIFDSQGAHVEEELDALNAYGELIAAASAVSGVIPQIALVLGSCVGSQAVLASLFDIVIMSQSAELSLSSAFLLGDSVGSAETAAKNGTAALVTETEEEAISKAIALLSYLPSNNLSTPFIADYVPSTSTDASVETLVDGDSFFALSSDYGRCVVTGLARVGGTSVGIIATGAEYNDKKLCGAGAVKIARFVRFCDAFSLPVITLLDCNGFDVDAAAEQNGDMKYIAMLTHAYAEATTAKITVITGKAYGSVYTAFAGKAAGTDAVFALHNAEIAALAPETAVQFLYKERLDGENRGALINEYLETVASPFRAAEQGLIDDVITVDSMAGSVISALEMLESKRVSTMNKKHSNIPL